LTAFLANIVRDEKKHPDEYSFQDFLVNWDDLWDTIARQEPELTEEEELARTESLLSKATAITAMFGGAAQ
jgi:hypothetical protein